MLSLGVGECGLSVDEFYDLTMDEFAAIIKGVDKRRLHDIRLTWEQARFIAYHSIIPHTGKKRLKVTDLIEFEWEAKEKKEQVEKIKEIDFDGIFPKTMK